MMIDKNLFCALLVAGALSDTGTVVISIRWLESATSILISPELADTLLAFENFAAVCMNLCHSTVPIYSQAQLLHTIGPGQFVQSIRSITSRKIIDSFYIDQLNVTNFL